MSYSTANSQKFTMIDDLPDLNDLEVNSGNMAQNNPPVHEENNEKYSKFIRERYTVPKEAGMINGNTQFSPYNDMNTPEQYTPAPNDQQYAQPQPQQQYYPEHYVPPVMERFDSPSTNLSCIDVANHIAQCPICSQLYKNDKSIYMMAIIILSVVCLLLLKKVLEL